MKVFYLMAFLLTWKVRDEISSWATLLEKN
jgi:hypothetical protein